MSRVGHGKGRWRRDESTEAAPTTTLSPGDDGAGSDRHLATRGLAVELIRFGIRTVLTVPGFPTTELADDLDALGADVRDAHNEKTAAELAYGLSVAGVPSAVLVKGNGALLCAEPMQNAGPHRTGAPLLLVVGDDTQAQRSTVPTDARSLGQLLGLATFDLPSGSLCTDTVVAALDAAVATRRPVILRYTGWLSVPERLDEGAAAGAEPRPGRFEPWESATVTKLARYLDFAVTRADELDAVARESPREQRAGNGPLGILASGSTWDALVEQLPEDGSLSALGITISAPLPPQVVDFCRGLDRVVVLEEGLPVVEDALQLRLSRAGVRCVVVGQRSGSLPALGPRSVEDVLTALRGDAAPSPELTLRTPDPDPEHHEYRKLFLALKGLDRKVPMHVCVGSCIAAMYPPYELATTALNLGGATGVAAGAAVATGEPTIALIGDYSMVHSGGDGHDHIYQRDLPVLTIVLANGRSAKTGGQPSAVASTLSGAAPIDLRRLVTRVAPEDRVRSVRIDEVSVEQLQGLIGGLLADLPATLLVDASD